MLKNKMFTTLAMTAALVFSACLILSCLPVRAADVPPQLDTPPEVLVDGFLKGLSSRVQLTPQELANVRPILIEQTRKRQNMARSRLAATPGLAGMKALRDDLHQIGRETDARLATVLPPDKLAAVKAYREERREEAKTRKRAG
ncbi:hypothetical protein DVDV_3765 [Desulfovibrio sp. DV]|uniref:hypothetical protein n=1 Tax=Desulfovibrio sp. DV TaxID=1844708 RepID=UPI00095E37B3|nr:hypothetical protein [Desulfovibrio sp. DV]OLN24935.1 hypothetical protein DVDV_3765 [Desulfovibrio sp. DV]